MGEASVLSHHPHPINMLPPTPAGLETLYNMCRKIYPDQANPLQVTALLKFWLGGPDPLDYISMYSNPGNPDENVPPHWHYISFGLSDLHGDGRVHDPSGPDGASGFGFELTFRLKREPGETSPPTWPATLMQSLAKYVFQSGNSLCSSDHVSWHCALDNSESRIQHMLMTTDPQLNTTETPFGTVNFVQIVGICTDELKATQQWNGSGILDILRRSPAAGGPWLITDMTRSDSIFELDPCTHEEVERGFELDGSNLSGVSGRCSWSEHDYFAEKTCKTSRSRLGSFHDAFLGNNIYQLIILIFRGRVKHGRHFTFKSALEETAVTLVAHSVTGTLVNPESPYVSQGSWLQVLITDDLSQDMGVTFQALASPEALSLPKTFSWPERKLSITIVADKV
uniref:Suppressor of fused homolog n=1 Tax=Dendroctonus ponderosae TaxID=77166 RepID=A0AAR5PYW5_DENPD